MHGIFRKLLTNVRRRSINRLPQRGLRAVRRQPRLTMLEDRAVPATYLVNALTDTGTGVGLTGDLRYCVTQANASIGVPDIINFDNATTAGQTILITSLMVISDDVAINGPTLKGPGDPNVTLDATGAVSRHFQINIAAAGGTASFTGLRMTGGAPGGSGGAVLISSVDDTYNFTDDVFDANTGANYGGAIGCDEPTGVANYGTFNITRCKFTNNKNSLNFGGALALNVLISGAGVTKGYTCNITDTTFDSNVNDRNGGALFIRGYACTVNVANTTFSNNELALDGFGGTISNLSGAGAQSSTMTFTNCTFSGNKNTDDVPGPPVGNGGAGGVFGNGGGATPTIVFRNSTFTGNTAAYSGGVFAASSGTPSVTFESCILFGNTGLNTEFEGGIISAKNSIINSKSGAASFTDLGGNQYGATADPLLGPLGTVFGGLTAYHVPGSGSPARENGFANVAVTTDQRGGPRLLGSKVDVGSIESQDPVPIASATANNVLTPSVSKYQFTVTYSDDVAVVAASIGTGDVTVTGPNGFSDTPTLVGAPPGANGTPLVVMYEFTPPVNGAAGWDFSDNGVYTINMVASQVSDAVPNFVKAGALTTFSVGIPQTFTVNALGDAGVGAGTKGDIRYAINQANAAAGAIDNIVFDPTIFGQTIKLSGTELPILEAVNITGPGGGKINISGEGFSRVFNLSGPGSYTVNVSGVTVSGGLSAADAGGFLISDETLVLSNVVLSGNSATTDGGAVVITSGGGKLIATDCTFTGNNATTAGGAIATNANAFVTLDRCTIQNNTAGQGGAIDINLGNLTITNSLLANNTATGKGGAISLSQVLGTLLFSNSTFSGNLAGTTGGAVSSDHAGGTLSIRNVTMTNNNATGGGGGLYHNGTTAQPGDVVIVSSIIAGNTGGAGDLEVTAVKTTYSYSLIGAKGGAGVYVDGGNNLPLGTNPQLAPLDNYQGATFTHALLPGSPAVDAGSNPDGLSFDQRGTPFARVLNGKPDIGAFEGVLPVPGGVMTPIATIVTPGATPDEVVVTYQDETGINVATIGTDDIQILDPASNPLTILSFKIDNNTNGSPRVVTYKFAIPVNGAAGWDVSDDGKYTVSLVAGKVSDTDVPTPHTTLAQNLGSFNVLIPTVYLVDEVSDVDDLDFSPGKRSLREAIDKANNDNTPSVINFTGAFAGQTIQLINGEMSITDSLTINGPGTLTLQGQFSRHFNITAALGDDINISGLKLTDGTVTGFSGGSILNTDANITLTNVTIGNSKTDVDGGAIYMQGNGDLTLVNSTMTGNSATIGTSTGGAIHMQGNGALTIQNSLFTGNMAGQNGGTWYFYNGGSLNVTSSTISGNKSNTVAAGLGGGGGYFFGAAGSKGVNIRNSTFSGNDAGLGLGGGGLMFQAGLNAMLIENCTFSGNTALGGGTTGYGGGLLVNAAGATVVTIRNSTFTQNQSTKAGGGVFIGATSGPVFNSTIIAGNKNAGSAVDARADIGSVGVLAVTGSNNLIGINDATSKLTFGAGNPLIGTTGSPQAHGLDPVLALNGAPAGSPLTHALLAGSPAIDAGNNVGGLAFDQRGTGFLRESPAGKPDIGAFEVQGKVTPPTVTKIQISDGSAQRSMIQSIKVTFSEAVTLGAGAFILERTANGSLGTVNLNISQSGTDVTITFLAGGTVGIDPAASLQDGTYKLTLVADKISGTGGTLDGDGDGLAEGSPVDNKTQGLHRLFGDANGDGNVTSTDFAIFRSFFGLPLTSAPQFNYFGASVGNVGGNEFAEFRKRFGLGGYAPP